MPARVSPLRLFTLWLALSGVLLRGLIPAGFMPGWTQAADDGSRSWLMICPAGELQALVAIDPHAQHHHHHRPGMVMAGAAADEHAGHRIGEAHLGCPFAGAAAPVLPLSMAALALPPGRHFLDDDAAPSIVVTRPARRLPPARAPPVSIAVV